MRYYAAALRLWPLASNARRQIAVPLIEHAKLPSESPWTTLAAIQPALVINDVKTATWCFLMDSPSRCSHSFVVVVTATRLAAGDDVTAVDILVAAGRARLTRCSTNKPPRTAQ